MEEYRILLFCDSRYRDTPGVAILKYRLSRLMPSAIVVVASYNYWRQAIDTINPHVVVINHIQGKRNETIANAVHRNGGLVFVLFNEGIIEFEQKREIYKAQANHPYVDCFLCWNQEVADIVGGVVVGNPRFDVYTLGLADDRELVRQKYGLSEKVVLFASSFPSAKFQYMLKGFHRSNWNELGNNAASEWSDPDEFARQQYRHQSRFKAMMLLAREAVPDHDIVLKPHPMSDIGMWKRFCEEHDFKIMDTEYIFNALAVADIVVAKTGSIVVAEAWLAGVPVITLPFGYDSGSSAEQENISANNARTIDEFLDFLKNPRCFTIEGDMEVVQYLQKWGMLTDDPAGEAIAEVVADKISERKPDVPGSFDLKAFWNTAIKHDQEHLGFRMDGFGNYNKACRQIDVRQFEEAVRRLR